MRRRSPPRSSERQRIDDAHWVAMNHLEGDFPGGGVADLRHRVAMDGDLVAELVTTS
jgi:hypothetical protein